MLKLIIISLLTCHSLTASQKLTDTAYHFQNMIEKWHLHYGQIRSVEFASKKPLIPKKSQRYHSDSTLVQGKYLAALSFQYATESNPETLKQIKRTLRTFYTLTHISGTPGLLCRQFYYGTAPKNKKHYFNATDQAFKGFAYEGKGNRDQTTGYLWGLVCAHELVNDPYCKTLSAYLLSVTVNAIYQEPEGWQDPWYYLSDWQIRQAGTGEAIRTSTSFRLLCLAIGRYIVKDPVYVKEYEAYFNQSFHLQSPLHSTYRYTEYYGNNLKLMRYLSVLFWEKDKDKRQFLIKKVNSIYDLTYDHQNPYFTYLSILASDQQNLRYLEEKYHLTYRLVEAKDSLKQFNEDYLWSSLPKLKDKETQFVFYYSFLRYGKTLIKGSSSPRPLSKEVLSVSERLPEAFLWHRTPYLLAREGEVSRPLTRRTGVDFLVAYWLGRYLRLIGENE